MAKWSRACGECRRRKVKCDETRPICTKCQRLGLTCAGWAENDGIVVFSANNTTKSVAKSTPRSRKARPVLNVPSASGTISRPTLVPVTDKRSLFKIGSHSSSEATTPTTASSRSPSPESRPGIFTLSPQTHQATIAILESNCPSVDRVKWRKLIPIFDQLPQGHALLHITYASSFLIIKDNPGAKHESRLQYGRALKAINKALQHPTACLTDENLLAILSLTFYEFNNSNPGRHVAKHMTGMAVLAAKRGPESFEKDEISQFLFREMYHVEAVLCMDPRGPPRRSRITWPGHWEDYVHTDPLRSLAIISDRIPELVEKTVELMGRPQMTHHEAQRRCLISALEKLDQDLLFWFAERPVEWYFDWQLAESAGMTARAIPRGTFFYMEPVYRLAMTLSSWRVYRIHVLSALMHLRQDRASISFRQIIRQLNELVDDIVDTSKVFFATKDECKRQYPNADVVWLGGCWGQIRPLAIALSVEVAFSGPREWILQKFHELAQEGFEDALMFALYFDPKLREACGLRDGDVDVAAKPRIYTPEYHRNQDIVGGMARRQLVLST